MKKYVVAGAGPAGVNAAETLRGIDDEADIHLISAEDEPVYSRMAIPYLLSGEIKEQGTQLRHTEGHFDKWRIDLCHELVAAVDTERQLVRLSDGEDLSFDRLLLATGSQPLRPPIPGLERDGVHHCWTLEDARHIQRLAKPGARVVLIGAGFIGCIILEALVRRGVHLTVLEMGDRMVPRMLDDIAGNLLKNWCLAKGVDVRTSVRVSGIEDGAGDALLGVTIESGGVIPADLVVVAAGVKPNIDFLAGSGIDTAQGILVDEYLQTSAPGVFAAGDCCQGFDAIGAVREVHAIQPTATEHGRVAALNMAGQRTPYAGSLNMNVLDTLGLISTSYGLWMGAPDGDSAVLHEADGQRYLRLEFQQDRLIGALSVGHTHQVGVLRGLIQSRLPLGRWKARLMEDPSRFMEAYLANTQFPLS
jgi:NADPH-dependent 2,4-dienoyl-CoA reductase/sulfur reductase-like enzyme